MKFFVVQHRSVLSSTHELFEFDNFISSLGSVGRQKKLAALFYILCGVISCFR